MAHKAIQHMPIQNMATGRKATIHRCTEGGDWVVHFYRLKDGTEWQYLGSPSDYFTDDKADAYGTAEHYIK